MYKCTECGKEFESARKLGGHKSSHNRGESYRKKRETDKSKKKREDKDKTKKCQYCNKEFENGLQLGGHVVMCKKNPKYIQTIEKMSNSLNGRIHTKETKEILSEKRSIYLEEEGKGGFKNIKWYEIKNLNGEKFIVRGAWELKIAQWLNDKGYNWIRKVYLKYKINNINKTYCPDFYIPEEDLYLEVKGYYSQIDKIKMEAVLKQNDINLKMIFANHINNLKSINVLEDFK